MCLFGMNIIFITLKTVLEILSGKINGIYWLIGLSVKKLPDDQIRITKKKKKLS